MNWLAPNPAVRQTGRERERERERESEREQEETEELTGPDVSERATESTAATNEKEKEPKSEKDDLVELAAYVSEDDARFLQGTNPYRKPGLLAFLFRSSTVLLEVDKHNEFINVQKAVKNIARLRRTEGEHVRRAQTAMDQKRAIMQDVLTQWVRPTVKNLGPKATREDILGVVTASMRNSQLQTYVNRMREATTAEKHALRALSRNRSWSAKFERQRSESRTRLLFLEELGGDMAKDYVDIATALQRQPQSEAAVRAKLDAGDAAMAKLSNIILENDDRDNEDQARSDHILTSTVAAVGADAEFAAALTSMLATAFTETFGTEPGQKQRNTGKTKLTQQRTRAGEGHTHESGIDEDELAAMTLSHSHTSSTTQHLAPTILPY